MDTMIDDNFQEILAALTGISIYQTRTTYGYVIDVSPYSEKAREYLIILEPLFHKCHRCGDKAVRVGIFETDSRKDKIASEFRALCERHKRFGLWSDADTAWGW